MMRARAVRRALGSRDIVFMRLAAALLFAAGCTGEAPPPPPPFKTVATIKQVMTDLIDPAADAYWDAVGSTSDKRGTVEFAPKTDSAWTVLEHHASVIAESGNLLMMEGRTRDQGEWMTLARELVDAGEKARRAAELRKPSAVFDAGAEVYQSCTNCHVKYLVATQGAPGAVPSSAAASPAATSPAPTPPTR